MILTNGKKVLKAMDCDAFYTSCEFLMQYVTGLGPENGCVIVDKTGTTLYTDMRYMEAAKKLFCDTDVNPVLYKKDEVLTRLASYEKVGVSFKQTSHAEYIALEKEGVKMQCVDENLVQVMSTKNAWEIEQIQKACNIAEEAFLQLLPQIKEGMSETQVAAILEYNMRALGAEGTSFATIVAFGAHAAVPHHQTGETCLKFGDQILIDFGCKVNGYCSDITRTFLFGDDGNHEQFKKAYAAVLKAHNLVQEKAQSGMLGKEIDAIARDYLKQEGYGDLFTHSLGHGIGLNVHEMPSISPRGEKPIENGMVFSDEPGVYVAGEYGIRIEDTVRLEDGKVKSFMSKTDKNLIIL